MPPARSAWLGLALASVVLLASPQGLHGLLDPCAAISEVTRGDYFTLGLVLIPGADANFLSLLYNTTQVGICSPALVELLGKYGARVAVFNLKVDRLQVLRFPYPDIIFPMLHSTPPTMTVMAFRGTISSTPAYVASASLELTEGAGFAISLALLLRFDKGVLQYLQWYDMTCNSCGGQASQLCLHQTGLLTCATPLWECTCSTNSNSGQNLPPSSPAVPEGETAPPPPPTAEVCDYTSNKFEPCSSAINVGWMGTDKYQTVFFTGSQIQRVNSFSLISIFYDAKDIFTSVLDYTYQNIQATWGTIQSEGQIQEYSLSNGLGISAGSGQA